MNRYTLYWGIHPQWTRPFGSEEQAVHAARLHAGSTPLHQFRLVMGKTEIALDPYKGWVACHVCGGALAPSEACPCH